MLPFSGSRHSPAAPLLLLTSSTMPLWSCFYTHSLDTKAVASHQSLTLQLEGWCDNWTMANVLWGRGRTDPPQRSEIHSSAGGHAIRGKEVLELPQSPEPFLKDQPEWVSLNGSHWANELLHLESNPELKLISTQPEEINQENKQTALDIH